MTAPEPILPPGYRLARYDRIASTNEEAKRLGRDRSRPPIVVWASEQTAGRGRRGRAWASPPGNLYLSLLLRPDCAAKRAPQLSFVAAVALADSLADFLPEEAPVSCKWPNDILLGGRKTAGILLESETGEGGGLAFLIVGVGVNLVSSPRDSEFPATSLAEAGAPPVAPARLLERFVADFDRWQRRWREEGFAPVRERWLARASFLGQRIRVRLDTVGLCGRFLDIDAEGALLLEAGGERRRVAAGAVFPATGG
ncbi:MAG TPA: biotin--[acetyl-CoA-carboxylase] ligase [Stellaceae bacterium]|nr:biotin--[acetyl-CoA-carboxylase] ligase [Stellaceae bacterium]